MAKQQPLPILPADVLRIATAAVYQIGGLAQAAQIIYEQAEGGHPSVELTHALRHMARRIDQLSDGVLYPLLHTGDEHFYDSDDLEAMKELVGE